MVNVQFKHAEFSNSIVNDECGSMLHVVADDSNPDRPDRFWIMTNSGAGIFTYGTKTQHHSAEIPTLINGMWVKPQIRTGGITYHGPGQLSWVGILNYRRLRRRSELLSINELMQKFCNSVNAEFSTDLVSHPEDPGLYLPSGEKIASYGMDAPGVSWVALKISLNLQVDLGVYENTTICGVQNRPMGNLLSSLPDLTTQAQLGESIVRRFCDELYSEHQITDWAD